ncbi:MAG: 3-phosphoshikimate 1-carboxyvinyltransferase [Clostridia bacterium]|nr:3-phosphoshikimate 1-carboxyvinyltransferase [Clostridia bacterium]
MEAVITPSPLIGNIDAPASKSVAHRALICAAFADKPTKVRCSTTSVDIEATAQCLRELGAKISKTEYGFLVEPITRTAESVTLNCHESGSTLRFMLPVAATSGKVISLYGEGKLPQRPITQLCSALTEHGVSLSADSLPLTLEGKLTAGTYEISGEVSSQFISGLLLALPVTHAESTVTITGQIQSKPYIDMTLDVLKSFGIKTDFTGNTIKIYASDGYISPENYSVEGDWSNGAFFICANAISGNNVKCSNLTSSSVQGDKAVAEIAKMLTDADENEHIRIDVGDIPDLVPVLAVTSCFRKGTTQFYNAARLKIKESDRLLSTSEMIKNLGGKAETTDDSLTVYGSGTLRGGTVDSFNDHRIVMSTAVAASGCKNEVTITNAQAVNKSFPTFFEEISKLGAKIQTLE